MRYGNACAVFRRCRIHWLLMFGMLIPGASCRLFQPRMFSQSRFLLDTLIDITVVSDSQRDAAAATEAAYREIERIEALLSKYQPESLISAVNRQAGDVQAVHVDPETTAILQRALQYSRHTDGAFNITIGPIIHLWGIGTDDERVPETSEIQQALQFIDVAKVDISAQGVRLRDVGMSIDLGAIAKGYSIDRAIATLRQHGIQQALVNAGGDIRCLGVKPDGTPWRIGIQHPRDDGIIGVVELQDAAITTSGDYERMFVEDGIRYHHLFDPQSGRPARGCQSVTILTTSAEAADVYSTAVFIMGPERGLAFIERSPELEGMIIDAEGKIFTSSGFVYTTAK